MFCALGLESLDAQAYCRGVAANAPAGYDPALDGCFAPTGAFDLYWKNLCVGYSLQKDASPLRHITLAQATQVAEQAFARWTGVSCASGGTPSIKADDLGPVECGLVQYNSNQPNQHVIILHDDAWPYSDPSNTLGLTTITYDATDGEIFDADMEINSHDFELVASGSIPPGGYDLASVVTHEAGHFLGLAHSALTTAVMYAHYHPGLSMLTVDDDDGICSVYPPGMYRVTSSGPLAGEMCDPTPRHGFSSACASANAATSPAPVGSAGEASPPLTRQSTCAMAHAGGVPAAPPVPVMIGFLGWLARYARRRRTTPLRLSAALTLALIVGTASTFATRDAGASVSVAVLFEELARDSRAVATVTPIEQRSVLENGRIYSYARVSVDELVAGDLPKEVWIRTMGGVVGTIGQVVDGEAAFIVGHPSLLFLRERSGAFEVVARGQGQFPVVTGADGVPRLVASGGVGALLPPPPARIAGLLRVGVTPRFARDVLNGRPLPEATRDIVATWTQMHTAK